MTEMQFTLLFLQNESIARLNKLPFGKNTVTNNVKTLKLNFLKIHKLKKKLLNRKMQAER